ncbi:hypothetical protein [Flavihumibacter solisilvae]|uniref:Uncharacterized protein n=1 Tax=Flavihumibacter solisilvae TaxID=1349421 RepID=A0A0C1LGH6_9BACT|nr:hypothetical protein [Flavihumibacter solisilvae]KIC94438.1 hypothetical protein OI18_12600 [Flavihumibacter solisilvae]
MKRQTVFYFIAAFYLVIKLAEIIVTYTAEIGPASKPGWHVIVPYNSNYGSSLTILFFLGIALLYGTEISGKVSKPLFLTHATLSIIPAIALTGWGFFFGNHNFEMEKINANMQASLILDLFFILSQATIILILVVKMRR